MKRIWAGLLALVLAAPAAAQTPPGVGPFLPPGAGIVSNCATAAGVAYYSAAGSAVTCSPYILGANADVNSLGVQSGYFQFPSNVANVGPTVLGTGTSSFNGQIETIGFFNSNCRSDFIPLTAGLPCIGFQLESFYDDGSTATVTITIASPGVITIAGGHFFALNSPVVLATTGALPTGLVAGTTYYARDITATTLTLAATVNGAAINTSGSQSGVQSVRTRKQEFYVQQQSANGVQAQRLIFEQCEPWVTEACTLNLASASPGHLNFGQFQNGIFVSAVVFDPGLFTVTGLTGGTTFVNIGSGAGQTSQFNLTFGNVVAMTMAPSSGTNAVETTVRQSGGGVAQFWQLAFAGPGFGDGWAFSIGSEDWLAALAVTTSTTDQITAKFTQKASQTADTMQLLDSGGGALVTVGPNGQLTVGTTTLTGVKGEIALAKITASGSAPGAAGLKFEAVCGTNAGSAKIITYAGTSTTPVTIVDNVGSGVTGC